MSSVWKKPRYTPRQQENTWMNLLFNSHGQFCDCDDPTLHFMVLLNRDSSVQKPVSDIRNIKCLLTGTDAETGENHTEEEAGFYDGELEKLFDQGPGDENTTEEDAATG